ncbi:SUMF1/EgtB/PvdO family nonheme iron enzyme [Providencia rustigianii]|uniref:formylglycine-generating enzyme family protein n=1 Tax=Providencia rustigianii TaxID=158850 RepID=UPI000D892CB2|nr:SUMF1/EgtB/PvdO family nonheme iron enzyme [Providencia rustigianii]MTC61805.1 SUMF1/EgtB/PvdO family nonheme iron enzyme [Providencia rustigianii]SPY77907.1 Serine/threonine-protein kinase pkn1 [Providencia rustigianii]VEH55801.1 Serine/threonine-protein kinase pkn1 [Providencia rustigianii]
MIFFNQTCRTVLLISFGLLTGCDQQLTTEQENQKQQLINDSLQNMVFIEGGTFLMGDFGSGHDGKSTLPYSLGTDNKFVHDVTLDSFSLSKYRVTWRQFNLWRALTGLQLTDRYNDLKSRDIMKDWQASTQDNYPASADWQDAKDYCLWLGQQAGLPIDLPTEAQWEYAARNRGQFILFASKDGTYNDGSENTNNSDDALFAAGFYPIGSYPPTPLGLYDMMGNGLDWTNDWYAADYYEHSPKTNPQGPEQGEEKVVRGSESSMYLNTLVMNRWYHPLKNRNIPGLGFRCAVQSPAPIQSVTK